MNIILNGKPFDVPPHTTIAELIQLRQLKTPAYAVEQNQQLIFRKDHPTTQLSENDQVEIVVAVGGG